LAKRSFISRNLPTMPPCRRTRSPLVSSVSVFSCFFCAERVLQNMKRSSGTTMRSITHMPPAGGSAAGVVAPGVG
jgi:hypothetical protein